MDEQTRRDLFRGKVILAPMTKGGNLPYRRWVRELGAQVTMGEMAMADKVVRRARGELALLRRAPDESCFGVQLAGRKPEDLATAARVAQERGAAFVDLNLGCPIDLFCRRGLGAALLEKPNKVSQLVAAMRQAVDIAVSVKLRLGWDEQRPRFLDVARAAEAAGADAVTLHGRSRTQRYRRAADWGAVAELARAVSIPVIGNGDLLTWREVRHKWEQAGCASVMIGRGALIKPWIFREIAEQQDLLLTPDERVALLRRYVQLAREHFGEDEHGLERVRDFLGWHLDFFNRYRPVPSEDVAPGDHPLIQSRSTGAPEVDGWLKLLYRTDADAIAALVAVLVDGVAPPTEEALLNPTRAEDTLPPAPGEPAGEGDPARSSPRWTVAG